MNGYSQLAKFIFGYVGPRLVYHHALHPRRRTASAVSVRYVPMLPQNQSATIRSSDTLRSPLQKSLNVRAVVITGRSGKSRFSLKYISRMPG